MQNGRDLHFTGGIGDEVAQVETGGAGALGGAQTLSHDRAPAARRGDAEERGI